MKPTEAQLLYLAELANRLNRPIPQPTTRDEASVWIYRLCEERACQR